ncbi:MAG: hypothetical protein LUC40_06160, partial [Oscillospiraceae bacterium]|nr:hypothetical protein [Oscillospiraceae bacterium]
ARAYDLSFFGIDCLTIGWMRERCKERTSRQFAFDFMTGSRILWKHPKREEDLERLFAEYGKKMRKISIRSAYDVLRTRVWCIVALTDWR